jgi:hypothetical protein
MVVSKIKPSVLRNRQIKAKEKYIEARRKATSVQTEKRTIHDTAHLLEAMKLEHNALVAERKRLEQTVALLRERGKKVNPSFLERLRKIKKEDKENRSRFKLIKDYFETELRK